MPWEKVPAFLKYHPCLKKTGKKSLNRFRVPTIFATNRFTFEKFPPPLPLLHPTLSRISAAM